jgi:signal transduction histidine kinase
MNNLAGIIPVSTQRLRERVPADPKTAEILDTIDQQAEFLLRLSDGLLMPFSPAETTTFDVNVLIREATEVARPILENAGIGVVYRLCTELPPKRISSLLSEAFLELITNAAKSMPKGGTLTLESRLLESGRTIEASFSDTGCGVPPSEQDRVFELFNKGVEQPSMPRALENGIGFGLWWVKTFLQQWGADVALVWSEVGKGSTFVVSLPVEV